MRLGFLLVGLALGFSYNLAEGVSTNVKYTGVVAYLGERGYKMHIDNINCMKRGIVYFQHQVHSWFPMP